MVSFWQGVLDVIKSNPKKTIAVSLLISLTILAHRNQWYSLILSRMLQRYTAKMQEVYSEQAKESQKINELLHNLSSLFKDYDIFYKIETKKKLVEFSSRFINIQETRASLSSKNLSQKKKIELWNDLKLKTFYQALFIFVFEPLSNVLTLFRHLALLCHDEELKLISCGVKGVTEGLDKLFDKILQEISSNFIELFKLQFESKIMKLPLTVPIELEEIEDNLRHFLLFLTQIVPYEHTLNEGYPKQKKKLTFKQKLSKKIANILQNLNLKSQTCFIENQMMIIYINSMRTIIDSNELFHNEEILKNYIMNAARKESVSLENDSIETSNTLSQGEKEKNLEEMHRIAKDIINSVLDYFQAPDTQILLRHMVFYEMKKFSNRLLLLKQKKPDSKSFLANHLAPIIKILEEEFINESSLDQTETFYQVRMKKNISFVMNEEKKNNSDANQKSLSNDSVDSQSTNQNKIDLMINENILREFQNWNHIEMSLNEIGRKIYFGPYYEKYFHNVSGDEGNTHDVAEKELKELMELF